PTERRVNHREASRIPTTKGVACLALGSLALFLLLSASKTLNEGRIRAPRMSAIVSRLIHSPSSVSRALSGRSSIRESWADKVEWLQGSLLVPESWKDVMNDVTAVVCISCVGGFGSNSYMYKINGTSNINAIRAAAEKGITFYFLDFILWQQIFLNSGVKRFVYISAADFGLVNYLLQGYYEGKRAAEAELLTKFTYGG
ncbi:hypothetical protein GW17_00020663, partial [Ensete ventricosum]